MKTSDDNIFACGDCVQKVSFFGGKPPKLKLASIATVEAGTAGMTEKMAIEQMN
jgi:NADH oxidase (H2O2-forming)